MARNKIATVKWADDESALTFNFANGETRVLTVENIPTKLRNTFLLHGAEQKFRDCYAGKDVPVAEALARFDALHEQIFVQGDWSKRAGTGEPRETQSVAIVRLMAETKGLPFANDEAIKAWIERMKTADKWNAIKKGVSYIQAKAKLELEKASATTEPDFTA